MGGHISNAGLARKIGIQVIQKFSKVSLWGHISSVGIDILSNQGDFFVTAVGQIKAFLENTLHASGLLHSSCCGNYAVGTMLVATVNDIDESFHSLPSSHGLGKIIVFHMKHWSSSNDLLSPFDTLKNILQKRDVLWPQHHIDFWYSSQQFFTFLLGNATSYDNGEFFSVSFPSRERTKHVIKLLFRMVSNTASVEQHYICFCTFGGWGQVQIMMKDSCQALAICNVHLAAIGLDHVFLVFLQCRELRHHSLAFQLSPRNYRILS
mmetsp:Transcript_9847/g.23209  ORF Transcript_9847/g.23209 Transcript_9847/m.23209 type:complete len:265 (-) Transcript_9847:1412-2206(-)